MEARAKVNLTLEVLGVRADGYHELRSLVMPISLSDKVSFASADDISLSCCCADGVDAAHLGAPEQNLVWQAAELMRRRANHSDGVAISLEKHIPIGAGLGGGSADAAATLVGLNDFWGLGLSREALAEEGARLGSDVPALVLGGGVLMEGRGERVMRETPAPVLHLVLVLTGVFTSTGKVYAHCVPQLTNGGQIVDNMRRAIQGGDPQAIAAALQNDLAAAAEVLHPEIARARVSLLAAGALGASMTGSGSCVFGVARDAVDAHQIACRLAEKGVTAVPVHTCPVM